MFKKILYILFFLTLFLLIFLVAGLFSNPNFSATTSYILLVFLIKQLITLDFIIFISFNLIKNTEKVIIFSFYLTFILIPLFFTPFNSELFEYNKMFLIYTFTTLILSGWLIRSIKLKRLLFKRTPLDIFLGLFLLSQLISTYFSIDPHTSIWGYYSRSNGGLLSIICYVILFYALVSNLVREQALRLLRFALYGGMLVALWAIPEHFGYSLSCIILSFISDPKNVQFDATCWVQDVQARVFASLGQPNWLGAYLAMLIFPAIYFYISDKKSPLNLPSLSNLKNYTNQALSSYWIYIILSFYLAFTFTFSRGATLGFIAGVIVLILGLILKRLRDKKTKFFDNLNKNKITLVVISLLLINLLFGSALTSFKLITQKAPPPRPGITSGGGNQLENGGTESGQIRLIVWRGAIDVFKNYPLVGSGVETFAYSYYQFRPIAHNMVSEWDFLYNKAHNEYLNYLATTGLIGITTYLLLIFSFIIWSLRFIFKNIKKDDLSWLFVLTLLSSYISYLIQNIFGFSVVVIALLFYLIPAFSFIEGEVLKDSTSKNKVLSFFASLSLKTIYKNSSSLKITTYAVLILCILTLLKLINLWSGDVYYKLGSDYTDVGRSLKAYQNLSKAVELNPSEPLYKSDLGLAAAEAAVTYAQEDATLSAKWATQGADYTRQVLEENPANLSLWRTAIRAYYTLSTIDPSYNLKTIETVNEAIRRAPTDPKLYYNKALIQNQIGDNKGAVETLKKAIEIKPNYREAYFTLGIIYEQIGDINLSIEQFNQVLRLVPNDPDARTKLEELKAKLDQ